MFIARSVNRGRPSNGPTFSFWAVRSVQWWSQKPSGTGFRLSQSREAQERAFRRWRAEGCTDCAAAPALAALRQVLDGIGGAQLEAQTTLGGAPFDWNPIPELSPGVRHAEVVFSTPRRMVVNILRVELSHPDIRLAPTLRESSVIAMKRSV
jgi:hypothetical protein